jgi:hypothetical protein
VRAGRGEQQRPGEVRRSDGRPLHPVPRGQAAPPRPARGHHGRLVPVPGMWVRSTGGRSRRVRCAGSRLIRFREGTAWLHAGGVIRSSTLSSIRSGWLRSGSVRWAVRTISIGTPPSARFTGRSRRPCEVDARSLATHIRSHVGPAPQSVSRADGAAAPCIRSGSPCDSAASLAHPSPGGGRRVSCAR